MLFEYDQKSRFASASVSARPIIMCWMAGILLGMSYLILSGYLFWTALVLFGLIVFLIRDFRYGFYFMMLILPVDKTHIAVALSANISGYEIWMFPYILPLCLTLPIWFVHRIGKSEKSRRTTPINGLLIFMTAYMLVSLLWAPNFELGYLLAASLILNFTVFFLAQDVITDEATLRRAAVIWIVMGVITATGVIFSKWYSYSSHTSLASGITFIANFGEIAGRPAGFGGCDYMGGLLVTGIFITIGMLMTSNTTAKKLFLFFLVIYQAVGMIETASRGALIGLVGGLFLLFVLHPSTKNKILKYSFLSLFLILLTVLIAKPGYIDRILVGFGYSGELYFSEAKLSSTISQSQTDTGGLSSRTTWWKDAFQEMMHRPHKLLLGLGLGGFIIYSGAIYTHSIPLSFFFDMGLIGAVIFILLALILLNNFMRYLKHAKRTHSYYLFMSLVVAFVAELGIHGLIDYDFYSYSARMFWFPLSYVCAAFNVIMAENQDL